MTENGIKVTEAGKDAEIVSVGVGTVLIDKKGEVRLELINNTYKATTEFIKEQINSNKKAFKELDYFGKHYFVLSVGLNVNTAEKIIYRDEVKLQVLKVFTEEDRHLEKELDTRSIENLSKKSREKLNNYLLKDYLPENVVLD